MYIYICIYRERERDICPASLTWPGPCRLPSGPPGPPGPCPPINQLP